MLLFLCVIYIEKMARPSQAITFPEVLLAKYGNRPRANIATPNGSPIDVDMGSDEYGWHRDAVKVAHDRIRQIETSKKQYLRGARPYELLNLRTNRGAIVPFGINGLGGKFVEPPQRASEGELRGGIMFTKAGQDYLQTLLNKRQKQYAEMYAEAPRTIPTSTTDDRVGETALSAVYPLYDALLDDLRTLNVKSVSAFNSWWAMMLTTLPILGSNFREEISEIAGTLSAVAQPYADYIRREYPEGSSQNKVGTSVLLRLDKALKVLWLYIGSTDQNEEEDERWTADANYNALFEAGELPVVNGRMVSEGEWMSMRDDMQRNNLRHLLPQYGKAPIDAPAEVREELVRNLNKKAGVAVAKGAEDKTKDFVRRLIEAQARGEAEDVELGSSDFSVLSSLNRPLLGEQSVDTSATPATGRPNAEYQPLRSGDTVVSEQVSLGGLPARLREAGAVDAFNGNLGRRALPSGEIGSASVATGQGRPKPRKIKVGAGWNTNVAEHHRILNARNER